MPIKMDSIIKGGVNFLYGGRQISRGKIICLIVSILLVIIGIGLLIAGRYWSLPKYSEYISIIMLIVGVLLTVGSAIMMFK